MKLYGESSGSSIIEGKAKDMTKKSPRYYTGKVQGTELGTFQAGTA